MGDLWRGLPVLVTGASGFVGSQLVQALLSKGAEVTVLLRDLDLRAPFFNVWLGSNGIATRFDTERTSPLADGLLSGVNAIWGDLVDDRVAERAVIESEAKIVFHLAALAQVVHARRMPLETVRSNIMGTANVLEAVRRSGLQRPTVIIASSDKAYGQHEHGLSISEDAPFRPQHVYEAAKGSADLLAQAYGHQFGMRIGIARMANLYGPRDVNFGRLIPGAIRHAILRIDTPFLIRSDGKQVREYMHVDDAISAYLGLARCIHEFRAETDPPEIYNFGTDDVRSVLDIISVIRDAFKELRIDDRQPERKIDMEILNQAGDESPYLSLNSERARAALGWRPWIPLDTGIEETIPWYEAYFGAIYG